MCKNALRKVVETYIRKTPWHGAVFNARVICGRLPQQIADIFEMSDRNIWANTRALKHIYDKRTAEEFDFICGDLSEMFHDPDAVYRNKTDKRGHFGILKRYGDLSYFVSVELMSSDLKKPVMELVTVFRTRDRRYLNDYDLLWSRRDGATRSS